MSASDEAESVGLLRWLYSTKPYRRFQQTIRYKIRVKGPPEHGGTRNRSQRVQVFEHEAAGRVARFVGPQGSPLKSLAVVRKAI
jgi:hypothetical protein